MGLAEVPWEVPASCSGEPPQVSEQRATWMVWELMLAAVCRGSEREWRHPADRPVVLEEQFEA